MGYNTSFISLFELIEVVDFNLYALKSTKRFFQRKKIYLEKISFEKFSVEKPEKIYWSFNNWSFGDYCRKTSDVLHDIIWHKRNNYSSDSDQFNTESLILKLKKILRNDRIKYVDLSEKLSRMEYPINGLTYAQMKELTIERFFYFREVSIRETIYELIKLKNL